MGVIGTDLGSERVHTTTVTLQPGYSSLRHRRNHLHPPKGIKDAAQSLNGVAVSKPPKLSRFVHAVSELISAWKVR